MGSAPFLQSLLMVFPSFLQIIVTMTSTMRMLISWTVMGIVFVSSTKVTITIEAIRCMSKIISETREAFTLDTSTSFPYKQVQVPKDGAEIKHHLIKEIIMSNPTTNLTADNYKTTGAQALADAAFLSIPTHMGTSIPHMAKKALFDDNQSEDLIRGITEAAGLSMWTTVKVKHFLRDQRDQARTLLQDRFEALKADGAINLE